MVAIGSLLAAAALFLVPLGALYVLRRRNRGGQGVETIDEIKLRAQVLLRLEGDRADPAAALGLSMDLQRALARLGAQRDREAEQILFRLARVAAQPATRVGHLAR